MSHAARHADEGQEIAEHELSRAQVAFDRFADEKRAILADFTARIAACPKPDRLNLELELSIEFTEWHRANVVPRPIRPCVYRPLHLVGREPNRPGPLSDG